MDVDIPTDLKTKNEIDHLLINDMRMVENVECLPSFKFPSDYRIIRSSLKIQRRTRYKNYKKKSFAKTRQDYPTKKQEKRGK